jgi:DNA mismatch repair protein MutL
VNRIRLLPENVANQIAAGEVIERPASIVKELVENALDASARRIAVEAQAGGRSLVRVTDDGSGMSRDDALLCLERHATSKIRRAEDLASIATMGFRGEALPSIASVSRFSLTTRERDAESPEGTQVLVVGGKIAEVKAAGAPAGTSVEVRQVFFNLPARRKFLRTEETEFAHIQHWLTLAALAHPEVAFTFTHNGRTVWNLSASAAADPAAALAERLRALWGGETRLLPVNHSAALPISPLASDETESATPNTQLPSATLRVRGFIGAPGVSRATRDQQHLFVNRRPIESRGLNHALLEGYHNALMKGRYPVACLFIEIPPAEVDVNIHPAKREVKFHHERAVRALVAEAVRNALASFHTSAPSPVAAPPALPKQPSVVAHAEFANLELPAAAPSAFVRTAQQPPLKMGFAPAHPSEAKRPDAPQDDPMPAIARMPALTQPDESDRADGAAPVAAVHPAPLLSVPLRIVGVIGRLYVVLESDRGLVLLDQHAAHERVLYEQMLERVEQGGAPSQRLLLAETLELPARDAQFLRENLGALAKLGVGLAEFGERTFLLDALPPFVKVADARRFALDLVDELKAAGAGVNAWRLGEHVVAKTVCRHAVKANDPLAPEEIEGLLAGLRACRMPYTCPHGRPTLIEMNYRELEKKFGRAQ